VASRRCSAGGIIRRCTTLRVAAWALIASSGWLVTAHAPAAEVRAIAIMTPEDPNDYGWNQQGFEGARAVARKYGLTFLPATGLGYGDVHAQARELADDGASLIIAHASGYNTAVPEVGAEKHVPTAIVDRPAASKPGAVADYTPRGHEGAYLAGALAARTTRTGTIGIVVSAESPPWNTHSAAFAQGAKATDARLKLLYAVIGPAAYSDAAGARRVTAAVIAAGADVIFGQGDGASFGMLQAVETTRSTGGAKVWFIDVVGDKTPVDKGNLLSSVVWNLAPVYAAMVEDLKANKFGTRPYAIKLSDDSVQLLHTRHIPDNVWSELMAMRRRIVTGELKIEPIEDTAQVHALMSAVTRPPG
jgi:basic membrane protein A and related proteins